MSSMTERVLHRVTPSQIAAANAIHDGHMPGWASTDRALTLVGRSVPGVGLDAVTVKAAVVDRLYYTRHYRLGDSVERIVEVMADPPVEAVAMVEAIAPLSVRDRTHWYWSFASKYSHWFIDPELPIYDSWAIRAVSHHFGRMTWKTTAYRDFAEHVYALREASGLDCGIREMDRYLWMSGMYRAWLAAEERSRLGLSGEVAALFGSRDASIRDALTTLLGEIRSP